MPLLDQPIVLFCSERSGSNLIAKIFDAHPQICAPGASHLFQVMSECACRYVPGSNELRQAVLRLFDTKISQWAIDDWTEFDRAALLSSSSRAGEMVAALYAAEAKVSGKPHVLTKENSSFRHLPMITAQSDRPRILYMVRDPRDMALSWTTGAAMRGGVLRAAERWCSDQVGYLGMLSQLDAETPVAFLRYEDVLNAPEVSLRQVCADLDLPYSNRMLRFFEISSSALLDARRSTMWANLERPLLTKNAGKFRRALDDDQIAYIEAVAGELMTTFGYDSARSGKPRLGRFNSLTELRVSLAKSEPHDKPAYQALPVDERARFEAWSRLYAQMRARPRLSPATFLNFGYV